jgi:hypothetical protein
MKKLCKHTVSIAVMSSYFVSYGDRPEHPECDILTLTKELAIVLAIMLMTSVSHNQYRRDVNKLTLTNLAGPKNKWFFFICPE